VQFTPLVFYLLLSSFLPVTQLMSSLYALKLLLIAWACFAFTGCIPHQELSARQDLKYTPKEYKLLHPHLRVKSKKSYLLRDGSTKVDE
jgi:hypothetical protein